MPKASERKSRVVIADDDRSTAELYSKILKADGHDVFFIANNGVDAVKAATQATAPVDIVVMDQKMPRMGGLEAADKIKDSKPGTKILLVTAFSVDTQKAKIVDAILLKPVSKNELLAAVSKLSS
jgi:CheY-like chemotaxis protein